MGGYVSRPLRNNGCNHRAVSARGVASPSRRPHSPPLWDGCMNEEAGRQAGSCLAIGEILPSLLPLVFVSQFATSSTSGQVRCFRHIEPIAPNHSTREHTTVAPRRHGEKEKRLPEKESLELPSADLKRAQAFAWLGRQPRRIGLAMSSVRVSASQPGSSPPFGPPAALRLSLPLVARSAHLGRPVHLHRLAMHNPAERPG